MLIHSGFIQTWQIHYRWSIGICKPISDRKWSTQIVCPPERVVTSLFFNCKMFCPVHFLTKIIKRKLTYVREPYQKCSLWACKGIEYQPMYQIFPTFKCQYCYDENQLQWPKDCKYVQWKEDWSDVNLLLKSKIGTFTVFSGLSNWFLSF